MWVMGCELSGCEYVCVWLCRWWGYQMSGCGCVGGCLGVWVLSGRSEMCVQVKPLAC